MMRAKRSVSGAIPSFFFFFSFFARFASLAHLNHETSISVLRKQSCQDNDSTELMGPSRDVTPGRNTNVVVHSGVERSSALRDEVVFHRFSSVLVELGDEAALFVGVSAVLLDDGVGSFGGGDGFEAVDVFEGNC